MSVDASGEPGIAENYLSAADSFIVLSHTLTEADWATVVPCTPGWTVRDVLSHVSGIPDDALAGRLDGVATDPWTAAQVERNAGFTVDELLDRWVSQYEIFATAIEAGGQARPPFDCHAHEHDVRHALGRPGNRDHPILDAMATAAGEAFAELPVDVTIHFPDGLDVASGVGGPSVEVSLGRFEYFRSRLGRRSQAQLEAYDWLGDPASIATVQRAWWIFGVAAEDIVE